MRSLIKTVAADSARHLVFGSGGTRALLNGAGATFAFHVAGVSNWSTIGGISGGSIVSLLVSSGMHPTEVVRHAINTDFNTLFKHTDTLGNMLSTRLFRRDHRHMRYGIVSSQGLGSFLESMVSKWPAKFWTMAVNGKRQFLFTADGVFLYENGRSRRLSDKPAPIGLVIRASCAVPGIIEAIDYEGEPLFDGQFSCYGPCPTAMVNKHFGAPFNNIMAVDLVPKDVSIAERLVDVLGRVLSGTLRQWPPQPFVPRAAVVVRTEMEVFNSLNFTVDIQRKQNAVLAGFRTTCVALSNSGAISAQQLSLLLERAMSWHTFEQLLDEQLQEIGVMGGYFNPIHNWHLLLGDCAAQQFQLDRVLYIPSGNPPHAKKHLLDGNTRFELVEVGIADNPLFEASRMEIDRPGITWTIDTLKELKIRYGARARLNFIIGEDNIAAIQGYDRRAELLQLCRLLVACRGSADEAKLRAWREALPEADIEAIDVPASDLSSTIVRDRVIAGKPYRYLVPARVFDMVEELSLYKDMAAPPGPPSAGTPILPTAQAEPKAA